MSKLTRWEPENEQFWRETGSRIGWLTCILTTFSLTASFATWFVMSAVVVRLPAIGFKFSTMQLFWLAAIPGFGSGTLRLLYSFFIPVFGTRSVISITTIIKLIPMLWLGFAVQNPNTSWGEFMIIGYLCGLGGGDFSAYMPSTSLFFPKRLQGVSLGVQAGVGNFGVSIVQFVTPWIIGFVILGASVVGGPQIFTKADPIKGAITVTKEAGVVKDVVVNKPELAGAITVVKDGNVVKDVVFQETDTVKGIKENVKRDAAGKIVEVVPAKGVKVDVTRKPTGEITDVTVKNVIKKPMWVQNAAFWYIPWLIIAFILSVIFLRSLPIKGTFGAQFKILSTKNSALKHTWNCTITYIQSFGSFSGYSAAFPMMIKTIYGGFPDAPDPLQYAFFGPLVGGLIRAISGGFYDKYGGASGMVYPGIGMVLACIVLIFGGYLTPTSLDQFPVFVAIMLFMFLMTGLANAASFRLYPIVFAYSPPKGAQMLGWTGAWAAFGPFVFSSLIGWSITATGSAITFFAGAAIFYMYANWINWWYYMRKGAERFEWGNKWGYWWQKLSDSEKQRMIAADK